MNLKEKIESLLQQGALYRSQGLVEEALSKYDQAIRLIEKNKKIKNRDKLIGGIRKKMKAARAELEKFEKADDTPEISAKIQDIIKKQFAFSDDEDAAALEGAIALAKFGQFQRALAEFENLLERNSLRVDAAKNIIRCHMALSSLEKAVEQFKAWMHGDLFKPNQLNKVRVFFEATLEKAGEDLELPAPEDPAEPAPAPGEGVIEMPEADDRRPGGRDTPAPEEAADAPDLGLSDIQMPELDDDDEILDINSIGFTPESGPQKGNMLELNVSFQTGDTISVLIPGRDKDTLDCFQVDQVMENVQFYSPMAIFNGSGKIYGITQIESGPRRGDYSVDIKVITA